jgi:hypothetical protein
MAELNRAGRYDRMTNGVEQVTGRPAPSVREFVALHASELGGRRSSEAESPAITGQDGRNGFLVATDP